MGPSIPGSWMVGVPPIATLEAHAYYRGSVAPANSKRGILVAPNGTPYTRNGGNVLLGIEPAKTSSHRGVILNFMEIGDYVNGNYLADSNLTASHPIAPYGDQWTDSFVGVGQTKTFFGVTVTVHSQDSDGTTNLTVSGSLTSGQWAAAVQSLFAANAHGHTHGEQCGVVPSPAPFNPTPATRIELDTSGYELRSRVDLIERISPKGTQLDDPSLIDGPDSDSSLQPGLEPEHGYGCGCCC